MNEAAMQRTHTMSAKAVLDKVISDLAALEDEIARVRARLARELWSVQAGEFAKSGSLDAAAKRVD